MEKERPDEMEVAKKKDEKREEKEEKEYISIAEPFVALGEGFMELTSFIRLPKAKKGERKSSEKEKAEAEANQLLFVEYHVMKKTHGMLAW